MISKAKRIVIKLGSSVIAGRALSADNERQDILPRLAEEIHLLRTKKKEPLIVSSGAIAMGMDVLGLGEKPSSIPERQAVAAIGQGRLMARYDALFMRLGGRVAQVLFTHDDLADRKRFLNARNTIFTLFRFGVVPVINENDTVAVEELKFGDNDLLSALATNLVEADLLVILTDTCGLYDKDPSMEGACLIRLVEDIDHLDASWLGANSGALGTGGMRSKVLAAGKAAHFGAGVVIASGFEKDVITRIISGEDIGTFFMPKEDCFTSRKHWIAFSARPEGRVFVDDGAKRALLKDCKSLLPSGITRVDGSFDAGEVVHCVDHEGMEFARGIVNYSSREIGLISGKKSREIEGVLGYKVYDEVIHRDNLVVL
ncbi:MAG: glutamate 5-kinase [Deltaproteobacteria bacterium]|nr:glutamate 5-kinase [Deltaproteobacteria bacterium]